MTPWSLAQRVPKRAFDLLATTVALVLMAPVLLAIGLLVRLSSPGPALFLQERMGRGGRPFRIWKFRTMVCDASSRGPAITSDGDRRITRVGRVLRRWKLDELPQLVNVFVGEMSLVGPRPEVPKYLRYYSPSDREVLAVRPGITDPASIQYREEERVLSGFADPERAYTEVILPRKLALSRAYVHQQSFVGDVALIFKTLGRL
jgi:lipopolysaccharide/colanic/teichoic acid biosynthesis glycosyltransferase